MLVCVGHPDGGAVGREIRAADLAEEVVDLAGLVGLGVDDGDAVGGFAEEEGAGTAADGGVAEGAVAGHVGFDFLEGPPHARVPDDGGFVLVACGDVAHVRGPGAGEAVVVVAAEWVDGSAGVGLDDPGVWGVADDDAESTIVRGCCAVDGSRELVVCDKGVGLAVEHP